MDAEAEEGPRSPREDLASFHTPTVCLLYWVQA